MKKIKITKNGLSEQDELRILESNKNDKIFGPFSDVDSLMNALKCKNS